MSCVAISGFMRFLPPWRLRPGFQDRVGCPPVSKMAEAAHWTIQESPTLDLFEDCPAPACQLGYYE